MKNKEEITERIKEFKTSLESFVVDTTEWKIYNAVIKELEWVLEK